MSRNTHHRERDHFGVDLTDNIVLESDIERYPAGTTLTDVLTDLISRQAALENLVAHIHPLHVNAVIKKTISASFTASSVIWNGATVQFTADAVISL